MSRRMLLSQSGLAAPAIIHAVYANTLTNLIPELYAGLDVVSRELVGFIPSVNRNTGVERAAVGQSVRWPVSPELTTTSVTPSMAIPEPTDRTIGTDSMAITRAERVDFGWTGEEQAGLSAGVGYLTIQADLFAQGLRTLVNMIETDIAIEAAANASRAVGTAGTTPFSGTDLEDAALVRQVLDDNGAPASERSLIINTSAGVKMRKHAQLSKVNEAGTTMTLRDGELLNLFGQSVKESAAVQRFVKGTAAGATTNAAGYAVGARSITLAAVGTGTIRKGDVVNFAGDSDKYIAAADVAAVSGAVLTLVAPGLRKAIPAAATAITIGNTSVRNVGFTRTAIGLAVRPPFLPQGGDAALDSEILTDPRSGLSFEVRMYAGYRKVMTEVSAAWGAKVINPRHVAHLLG